MTDQTAQALILGIPAIVGSITAACVALAGLRQGRRNGVAAAAAAGKAELAADHAASAADKADETGLKTDALIEKSDEIHRQVNSNLSTVKSDLREANERITALQLLVETMLKAEADRLKGHP